MTTPESQLLSPLCLSSQFVTCSVGLRVPCGAVGGAVGGA